MSDSPKPFRGTIGVPSRDHLVTPTAFAYSLIRLIRHCDRIWGCGSVCLETVEGSLLEENRTALLNRARGGWLLMLDDDMTFPHDLAEKLDGHIEDGKDIVTGLYFLGYKQKPAPAIYTTDTTMGNPAAFYYNYPEDQLVEVGGCGMGVCMISRRVLNAFLGKEAFNRVYKMGTRVGEDLAFCYKARERGFRIWCDTSVKAGHIRPYTLTDNQPFVTMETYGKSFNG